MSLSAVTDTRFEYRNISEFTLMNGREVTLLLNDQSMGTVRYLRIPGTRAFVFYDLHIQQGARGKGFAKQLGEATLQDVLYKEKPSYIFIQPETFEPSIFPGLSEAERNARRDKLVNTYAARGFTVHNKPWLVPVLWVLYKLMGINEDPRFFMIGKGDVVVEALKNRNRTVR
jgi:GNAT superfamily N-acetyltransferase